MNPSNSGPERYEVFDGPDGQPAFTKKDDEAYISELEDKNTALHALVADIREWVNDRALPPHSEFIQGVRSAQERVRWIIAKHEGTP